jgi:drug/metabolite transporter (DMT)-like permease
MTSPFLSLTANLRAILWMVAAAFVFANMSGLVKYLGQDMHAFEIAFFRSVFGFVALLPGLWAGGGLRAFRTQRIGLHGVRVALGGFTMLCFFYAMTMLPLANAKALSFSQPLFMLLLAPIFLQEKIGWHRGVAVVIGFVGLVIAAQPGADGFSIASFAAIAGAFTMACAMIVVKKLAATERPVTIMAYFSLSAIVITALPASMVWVTPTWEQVGLTAVVGAMASLGQYLYIRGYQIGEASVIAPFNFLQIPFAGVVGYIVFTEIPSTATVIGGGIVVSSAIYIMRREAVLNRRTTSVQSTPAGN